MVSTAASTRPPSGSSGRRHRRRTAFVAGALAAGAISAGFGVAGATHASTPPGRMCFVTPAADGQPFGAYLTSMYRTKDDELQVLHRVECTDQTITYRWISGTIAFSG